MKIKTIDLLNKIANGEEIPKKILLNGIVFKYQGDDYLYKDEDKKEHWLFSVSYTDKYMWLKNFLKAEIEIIEEPKKIEKLPYYSLKKIQKSKNKDERYENRLELLEKRINDYHNKINELIDEINKLKEK